MTYKGLRRGDSGFWGEIGSPLPQLKSAWKLSPREESAGKCEDGMHRGEQRGNGGRIRGGEGG